MVTNQKYTFPQPIKILFSSPKCKFLTSFPDKLREKFSVFYPGYFFIPSYKSGHWDGKKKFISDAGYFPTGLFPTILAWLKKAEKGDQDYPKVGKITVSIPKEFRDYFNPAWVYGKLIQYDILESINPEDNSFFLPGEVISLLLKTSKNNSVANNALKTIQNLAQF